MAIGEDLHLDVPGFVDTFPEDLGAPEEDTLGLPRPPVQGGFKAFCVVAAADTRPPPPLVALSMTG